MSVECRIVEMMSSVVLANHTQQWVDMKFRNYIFILVRCVIITLYVFVYTLINILMQILSNILIIQSFVRTSVRVFCPVWMIKSRWSGARPHVQAWLSHWTDLGFASDIKEVERRIDGNQFYQLWNRHWWNFTSAASMSLSSAQLLLRLLKEFTEMELTGLRAALLHASRTALSVIHTHACVCVSALRLCVAPGCSLRSLQHAARHVSCPPTGFIRP